MTPDPGRATNVRLRIRAAGHVQLSRVPSRARIMLAALALTSPSVAAGDSTTVVLDATGITGRLFGYGIELSPPFVFEGVGLDTLYVNRHPYSPLRIPGRGGPPPEPGQIDLRVNAIRPRAEDAGIAAGGGHAGLEAAKEVLLQETDVESAEIGDGGLRVKFRFHPEPVLLWFRFVPASADSLGTTRPGAHRSLITHVQSSLDHGGLVAFGNKYRISLSRHSADAALAEIKNLDEGRPAHSDDSYVQRFLNEVATRVTEKSAVSSTVSIPRTGPPDSPLTVRPAGPVPPSIHQDLLERARRLAGEPSATEFVEYTDVHSWGEAAASRKAWRVVAPKIVWRRWKSDGRWRSVDVHLLFAENGRDLLVAYTQPRAEWVLPETDGLEPERLGADSLLAAKCEFIGPVATDSLLHRVPDVLTALGRFGIDPGEAGQVILRPRNVMKRGTSDAVPCWIVEVLGTVVGVRHAGQRQSYLSKRYLVIPDSDLTTFSGFRLP